MIIYIDKITGEVSLSPSFLTYTLTISDNIIVSKEIENEDGSMQTILLSENTSKFTIEDILKFKYDYMLNNSLCDNIIYDIFMDENSLDLKDANHSANTGVAFLELLPKGQAKTKTITLQKPTTDFTLLEFDTQGGVEIYLGGKKFVDGKLTLTSEVNSCTIKFVNTTNKPNLVKSYAIAY